jgi:hypothetical protein
MGGTWGRKAVRDAGQERDAWTRGMDSGQGQRQGHRVDIDIKYTGKNIRKITTWILSNTVFLAAWQRKMMTFNEFPRHI